MVDIERVFCGWLKEEVPDLKFVLDYEPQSLPRFPGTTLMATMYSPLQAETGIGEDVTYEWRLRLYVALNDYLTAQTQIKMLMPQILAVARHHPTCNGLVDFLTLVDEGSEPDFNVTEGWLSKDATLRAIRTET